MNKLRPVTMLLGAALLQSNSWSQPQTDPNAPQPYSIAELERLLGGRTLLSLNLKDASIQEVTAAMSQSSGQKIGPFLPVPEWAPDQPAGQYLRVGGAPVSEVKPFPPTATFTLAAQGQPFWEALRSWNIEARRAAKAVAKDASPYIRTFRIPQATLSSFGVAQTPNGWQTIPGNWLADGRAVSAWPFLVVATAIERAQAARLSASGLREPEPPRDPLALIKRINTKAPEPTSPPAAPTPEEKRWSEQLVLDAYALPDPKIFPSDLSCEITEAVDDKGNDLRLPSGAAMDFSGRGSSDIGKGRPFQIALASKPGMSKKLVRLRGVLRFSLPTRTYHWETTDLTTPVENTLREGGNDFKIAFKGVTGEGNSWRAAFEAQSQGKHLEQFWRNRVDHQNRNITGSHGIWGLAGIDSVRLVDANGRTFQRGGVDTSTDGIGRRYTPNAPDPQPVSPDLSPVPDDVAENWWYHESHNLSFESPAPGLEAGGTVGPPIKLIVDFALDRRQVEVPFEFTDLPLPPS